MKKHHNVKIRLSRTIVIVLTGCMLFIMASTITADPHYPPNEYTIPLQDQWNLITVPVNASIAKDQITIRNNSIDYNFTEAVNHRIIVGTIFGWDRENQTYFIANNLGFEPGKGYWLWAYYPCSLIIHSDMRGDGYITKLQSQWNIMGQTYNSSLALTNLSVLYNGTSYSWANATTANNEEDQPLIINSIFKWNGTNQWYDLSTGFTPGEGYWMYAYYNCSLRQVIDAPVIIDHSANTTGTGNSYICNASVSDPDGINSVWLEYWYGSSPHSFVQMNPTGVNSYYEKILTIPSSSVDSLHYIIAANDTKNYWNNPLEQTVIVNDDDVPVIVNVLASPSSTSQDGYVNISCDVSDNIAVNTVRLHLTYPDLSTINISMNKESHYYLNQSYSMGGSYQFFIWANDTSSNINTSSVHTFIITFNTHTITASAGTGGTITPSGAVIVNHGGYKNFTITPDTGYHILDVLVDGGSIGAVSFYNFTNVIADHSIAASFAINTYTISASAGAGGSITPSGAVSVNYDDYKNFTIAPDTGYHIADVLVDSISVGAVSWYNFTNVQADHTISATFAINQCTITASAGSGGSISPSGTVVVNYGGYKNFTITPNSGYIILDVLVDGISAGTVPYYNFTNVNANHTISASFKDNTPPTLSLNFAGNPSDSGGPYYLPGTNTPAPEGYYTNASYQKEKWIQIKCTATDNVGIEKVWLHWRNGSQWTNNTYQLTHTTGNYYEINMSTNIAPGPKYSFDLLAVDTSGNTMLYRWFKIGADTTAVDDRRYVQLGGTPTNISYTPYYFYPAQYKYTTGYGPGHNMTNDDILHHDQGPDGTLTDSGYLLSSLPTNVVQERYCTMYVGYWFDETITALPGTIRNIYHHFWWHTNNHNLTVAYGKSDAGFYRTENWDQSYLTNTTKARTNISYNSITYFLESALMKISSPKSFTDNDLYEFFVEYYTSTTTNPTIINNRSIQSFVVFNIPDNTTLQGKDTDSDGLTDYQELYGTFTNPFVQDTDNDGVSDYFETVSGSDPNDYKDTINPFPVISLESPQNQSKVQPLNPPLSININQSQNHLMNVTFRTNASGTWQTIGTNLSVPNGTYSQTPTTMNTYDTTYHWSVHCNAGSLWTNKTYHFTTWAGPRGWIYYKKIMVNHTLVNQSLTNFPILIKTTDTNLMNHAQPGARDVQFWDATNTTRYHHEIEKYNDTSGEFITWVNITYLSATQDTIIWMRYGNTTCGTQENVAGTWDGNYLMVQHLNETGNTVYDSTTYGNNGASAGTVFKSSGQIDGAREYDTDDYITVNNFGGYTNKLTAEAWIYRGVPATSIINVFSEGTHYNLADWILYLRTSNATAGIDFGINNHVSYYRAGSTPANTWFYLAATYNAGNVVLYVNSTKVGSKTIATTINNNYAALGLGNDNNGGQPWTPSSGKLDELRVSKSARNSSWIKTSYNTMSQPASFTHIGSEEQITYSLTVTQSGTGSGIVEYQPNGPYHFGTIVKLWANASTGSTFSGWSGALTGLITPQNLTMDGNKVVDAAFTLNGPYSLTITKSGTGSGTVEVNNSGPYYYGAKVTLWANASTGSSFSGWSGGLGGSVTPETLTIIDNIVVDAAFTLNGPYTLTITKSGTGSGTVEVNNSGPYYYGVKITLWANASTGSSFSGWSGGLGGSVTPESLTITADVGVDAAFTLNGPYTLTTTTNGTGEGTVERNTTGPYYYGAKVTLWANASVGSSFTGWSGALSGTVSPQTLTMDDTKAVNAEFTHLNQAPTHTTPLLVSEYGTNTTNEKLICSNQSTADPEGNPVYNTYHWIKNGVSVPNLLLSFNTANTTNVKDYSGYHNNGTVINGTIWISSGKIGGAYKLDGTNDYISIPDASSLDGDGIWDAMSMEFWIKSGKDGQTYSTILEKRSGVTATSSYQIGFSSSSADKIYCGYYLNTTYQQTGTSGATPILAKGVWYHVVCTFKSGEGLKIFVNGSLYSSLTYTNPATIRGSDTIPVNIGRRRTETTRFFNGSLDEVKFYPFALTQQQISQNFNDSKNGFSNVSRIVKEETSIGNIWRCEVTPSDGNLDGLTKASNSLTIVPVYTLMITKSGTGSGTVEVRPSGSYYSGTVVTLWANASTGSTFTTWSGALSSTMSPETLIMDGNKTVDAEFTLNGPYTLTMTPTGTGSGTIQVNVSGPYYYGAKVKFWANASTGSTFTEWSGALSGTTTPQDLIMDGDKSVSAEFTLNGPYTLTIGTTGIGGGTVQTNISGPYYYGAKVKLWANASTGSTFTGWSGALSGTLSPETLIMDSDKSVSAEFTLNSFYTLTITKNGTGSGSVETNTTGPYTHGAVVKLWANASVGSTFTGWFGALTGTTTPQTLIMDSNKTVNAQFTLNGPYTLTITMNGTGLGTIETNISAPYYYGAKVKLWANASTGSTFTGWFGALSGTTSPETLTMDTDKTVVAEFTSTPFLSINSNFDSGSIGSYTINGNSINFTLTTEHLVNSGADYTYWTNFKVQNTLNKNITFRITNANLVPFLTNTVHEVQIVYSYDGTNWSRFTNHTYTAGTYKFWKNFTANQVQIATFFPFSYSTMQEYLETVNASQFAVKTVLGKSTQNRDIDLLTITNPGISNATKKVVYIIGRQHSAETTSSHMLKGMIDFLISNNSDARRLRDSFVWYIVPMVNPDGVYLGYTRGSSLLRDPNDDWGNTNSVEINIVKTHLTTTKNTVGVDFFIDWHSQVDDAGWYNYIYALPVTSSFYTQGEAFFTTLSRLTDFDTHNNLGFGSNSARGYAGNLGIFTFTFEPSPHLSTWTLDSLHQQGINVALSIDEQYPLLLDSEFNSSTSSEDLRTNATTRDWFESRNNDPLLVGLDTNNIAGNLGKKAGFYADDITHYTYLSQEFRTRQTGRFTVSLDLYIDTISIYYDNVSKEIYNRTAFIFIGSDDSDHTNGPCTTSNERFVFLTFFDETPGDDNNDIILKARESSGQPWNKTGQWTNVMTNISYDTWYRITLDVDVANHRYTVYVDDVLQKANVSSYSGYVSDSVSHLTFYAGGTARGTFYLDNVFSPASDRHHIQLTTTGNGQVSKTPGESSYKHGSPVQITAVADPGWSFKNWTGDYSETTNPVIINPTSDMTITAIFTQDEYTITNTTTGSGTVSIIPYQATYHYNDIVEVHTNANTGWTFTHWTGALSGHATPTTLKILDDVTINAYFSNTALYTISLTTTGSGQIQNTPDRAIYESGSSVSLTAIGDPGWTFYRWTGDVPTGHDHDNPLTITMNANKTLTASFNSSAPTVFTLQPQNITSTSVTIRGNISDTGGESCSVWFEWDNSNVEECMGTIATGTVCKDGRSIVHKNRHYYNDNVKPYYYQGVNYSFFGIGDAAGQCRNGQNEKGLAIVNMDIGGTITHWKYQTDWSSGSQDNDAKFCLGSYSTVRDTAYYLALHGYYYGVNQTNGQYLIISSEPGVGAIVAIDRVGHTNITWINNTYAGCANAWKCDKNWDGDKNDLRAQQIMDDIVINGTSSDGDHLLNWQDIAQRVAKDTSDLQTGWQSSAIDTSGIRGLYTSITLDATNKPYITYYDQTNGDLRYNKWTGSAWSASTVDSTGDTGQYTSLALNSSGNPHISYYDKTNGNLRYAKWTGSAWSKEAIDSTGDVGKWTSLALDSNNYAHISYYNTTTGDLKYTRWSGTAWITQTIDATDNVGEYTSLALDTNGYPAISYYDSTNGDLKYAKWTGTAWNIETVDSVADVGKYTSLALDTLNRPHISYYNTTSNDLKYATWTGSTWVIETVDTEGDVGSWTSLVLDSSNHPFISYYDGTQYDVKIANHTGITWGITSIHTFPKDGQYSSIALDTSSKPQLSYYDETNADLKYVKWIQSYSYSGQIATSYSRSSTVHVAGNSSLNSSIHMSWLGIGQTTQVALFLPLYAGNLHSTNDIPSSFTTANAGKGIQPYSDVKRNYARGNLADGNFYCSRVREILKYANYNENLTFNAFDTLMDTIMYSANQQEARLRLDAFMETMLPKTLNGYIANTTKSSTDTFKHYPQGKGNFSEIITTLQPGTTYYVKAWANNTGSSANGSILHFMTKPLPPRNINAYHFGSTQVNLSWIKGNGSYYTIIERNTSGVSSWTRGEGIQIYNGTNNHHADTTALPTTQYYYQFWSYTAEKGLHQYSNTYASAYTGSSQPPQFSNVIPANGSIDLPLTTASLNITIQDPEGNLFSWTIQTSPNIGSSSSTGATNGTKICPISGLSKGVTYAWFVNATDGISWMRKTYSFTTIEPLLTDSDFNASSNSAELRTNGPNHDWYESRNDTFPNGQNQLTLNEITIAGNIGKKAKLLGTLSYNTYLSQEFSTPQTGTFSAHWDIYVDEILDRTGTAEDRSAYMMIGDDSGGTNGPCSAGTERFVYMAFVKPGGGTTGTADLVDKIQSGTSQPKIATINLDQWYTIKVNVNVITDKYDVYVYQDGVLIGSKTGISAATPKTSLTHISFATWNDGGGTFYVDNVYANSLSTNTAPVITNELPTNSSTGVSVSSSQLSIQMINDDGDLMDYTIKTNPDIGSSNGFGVKSGTKTCSISALAYGTTYTWHVNVTDGTVWTNRTYTFMTETSPVNNPPAISSPDPTNESTGVPITTASLSITVEDSELDPFNWSITTLPGIGGNSATEDSNGIKTCTISGLTYATTYTWYVKATDGNGWTNRSYTFTTELEPVNNPPILSSPIPANSSNDISVSTSLLNITIQDPEGNLIDWTIQTSPNIGSNSGTGDGNGTKTCSISGLSYYTIYTWFVNATDGTSWTKKMYTFTTKGLLADPDFTVSADDADLRANNTWQDWYESRNDNPLLLTLDTNNIGDNTGKKAAIKNFGVINNVYLTQEFSSPQSGTFDVSFDIYIDKIEDNAYYDRTGHIYIGNNQDGGLYPLDTARERYVLLAFYDSTPGDTGTDLQLRARTSSAAAQSWSNTSLWPTVASNLSYDTWYTIKVAVNYQAGSYDVTLNGVTTTWSKMDIYNTATDPAISFMSFSADTQARGDFYVDNVHSPAIN